MRASIKSSLNPQSIPSSSPPHPFQVSPSTQMYASNLSPSPRYSMLISLGFYYGPGPVSGPVGIEVDHQHFVAYNPRFFPTALLKLHKAGVSCSNGLGTLKSIRPSTRLWNVLPILSHWNIRSLTVPRSLEVFFFRLS